MRRRDLVLVVSLLAVALSGAARAAVPTPSAAVFSDSVDLSGNTATAAECASATTWTTLVDSSFVGNVRKVRQSLSTTTSAVPNDRWTNDNWTETSLVTNQPGSLYCSDDRAVSMDGAADTASSPSKSYSTWSANSTLTTLLWLRSTSTSEGRVISLAEGSSGSRTYAERAVWVTGAGDVVAGGRYSSSSSWTTSTTDVAVNDGRWHLLSVVWTATATSNVPPTIRVDGVTAATSTTGTVSYRARSSSGTSAAWYLGANAAGRAPAGAPTSAYVADYDEFLVVAGSPSATLLGTGVGSLVAAADR